jgi:hypothetical protein
MACQSEENDHGPKPETPPEPRGLILTPLWGLGDTCTTPAGKGLVTALVLHHGGLMTYRVRLWIGDEDGLEPVEIEVYGEELT